MVSEALDKKVWLVTGASGLLGSNMAQFLPGSVHSVGICRSGVAPGFNEVRECDILDAVGLREAIRSLKPDVIVHAAAMATHESCERDPIAALQINAHASGLLARLSAEFGARLIYISTDAVFKGLKGDYRETDDPEPFSVYGETKLIGEEFTLAENPHAIIARTNFFGWSARGDRSILEFFYHAMVNGESVRAYRDFIVTSMYAPQLVRALWALEESGHTGLIHVASRDKRSKLDFARLVAQEFDFNSEMIESVTASEVDSMVSRVRDISLNTELLQNLQNFRVPSQLDGIQEAKHDRVRLTS